MNNKTVILKITLILFLNYKRLNNFCLKIETVFRFALVKTLEKCKILQQN